MNRLDENADAPADRRNGPPRAQLALFLLASGLGSTIGLAEAQAQPLPCDAGHLQAYLDARANEEPIGVDGKRINQDLYPNIKATQTAPGQCTLQGTIRSRPNIVFQLRLPQNWKGKFFFEGGAGLDGYLPSAQGKKLGNAGNAVDNGYAVVSTNAGHFAIEACSQPLDDAGAFLACLAQGVTATVSHPFQLYSRFGTDEQQRIDYGYRAIELVTKAAKKLVKYYYRAENIERSYFVGCSNGGRQAMMAAKRLPQEYDGILAGAPAINLTKQAMQGAVDARAIAGQGLGDKPWEALTESDMEFIGRKVLEACDGLDGANDGMVSDPVACQSSFDPNTLYWYVLRGFNWWAKVDALKELMAGVRVNGEQVYGGWLWDPGIAAKAHEVASFRSWRLQSALGLIDLLSPNPYPIATVIGGGAMGYVVPSPPKSLATGPKSGVQMWNFLKSVDLASSLTNTYWSTDPQYLPSHYHYDVPSPHVLDGLAARKGKLIVFSGSADGAVASNDLIDWYEDLQSEDALNGRDTDSYTRFYLVPGMAHCGAGPSADSFDLFSVLEKWVDYQRCVDNSAQCGGKSPSELRDAFEATPVATVGANNKDAPESWRGVRSRPLCPYPQVARYKQSGDLNNANNFRCQ